MMGNFRMDETAFSIEAGIIPNAILDVFYLISKIKENSNSDDNNTWNISVSYLEIYNEQVYDLLEPSSKSSISLREDQEKGIVHVVGLSSIKVAWSRGLLYVMFR